MEQLLSPRASGRRRLYLVRHGEVNYYSTPQDIDFDPPLSMNGRAQVGVTAAFLKVNGVRIDRLVSSDLRRSRETAQIIASSLDVSAIETIASLNEIRGQDVSDLSPELLAEAFFSGVQQVPISRAFMAGETIREFTSRIDSAIEDLRSDNTWEVALLAVHGGVNTAMVSRALSGNREAYFAGIEQDYACLNVLDVGTGREDWVVRLVNFAAHHPLDPKPRQTTLEQMLSYHSGEVTALK